MYTIRATALSITLALAMACNPGDADSPSYDSSVQGRVDDGAGQQSRTLGGQGTVDAASTVRLRAVSQDGSLTLTSEAEVDSSGSYSLEAPSGEERMLLEALNAEGEVIASAILEATADAEGGVVTATPMDTESSVEAAVFLEMVTSGADTAEVNVIDLRGRIDGAMAEALAEAEEDGEDIDAELMALAEATWAAQVSEETAYADAGLDLTQSQMFELELEASQALNAALDAGGNAQLAYEDFFQAIATVHAELGASSEVQAESETQASLSMRLVLEDRLNSQSEALLEAAVVQAGEVEAWTLATFTESLFSVADVVDAVEAEAEDAAEDLEDDASRSDSIQATVGAYAAFSQEMVGQGSVLEEMLVTNVVTELTYDLIIDAALDVQGDFVTDVTAGVRGALGEADFGRQDAEAVADAVADARANYRASLASMSELSSLSGVDSALVVDVLVVADGSFVATR